MDKAALRIESMIYEGIRSAHSYVESIVLTSSINVNISRCRARGSKFEEIRSI